ncbi:MAG: hypothetical protein LBR91_03510 [Puniceicoccales bacterium]|jgi:hypothetical protein|nr:hypothetical protein [Puniceicoccales bacterium]
MNRVVVMVLMLLNVAKPFAVAFDKDLKVGNVYKINTVVPVFSRPKVDFKYESGPRGSNCYELNTMLLPSFYVLIEEELANGTLGIAAKRDDSYLIRGYIHRKFLEDHAVDCGNMDFFSISSDPTSVPSVEEIIDNVKNLLSLNVRYCYGGNSPVEVELNGIYKFHPVDSGNGKFGGYKCVGFDSSGLIHYVSNGWIPHSTSVMPEFGKILFMVNTERRFKSGFIAEILDTVRDTDLVLFPSSDGIETLNCYGHVIMVYKFGFVEYYGRFSGIVRTPPSEAALRLIQMYMKAKSIGMPLFVVRWHPELLKNKK